MTQQRERFMKSLGVITTTTAVTTITTTIAIHNELHIFR